MSSFWMSYIDMIDIVLGLIRASRESNWLLHLAMIREMTPWFFAYNSKNMPGTCQYTTSRYHG